MQEGMLGYVFAVRLGLQISQQNWDLCCSYMIPVDVVPRVSAGRLVIGIWMAQSWPQQDYETTNSCTWRIGSQCTGDHGAASLMHIADSFQKRTFRCSCRLGCGLGGTPLRWLGGWLLRWLGGWLLRWLAGWLLCQLRGLYALLGILLVNYMKTQHRDTDTGKSLPSFKCSYLRGMEAVSGRLLPIFECVQHCTACDQMRGWRQLVLTLTLTGV